MTAMRLRLPGVANRVIQVVMLLSSASTILRICLNSRSTKMSCSLPLACHLMKSALGWAARPLAINHRGDSGRQYTPIIWITAGTACSRDGMRQDPVVGDTEGSKGYPRRRDRSQVPRCFEQRRHDLPVLGMGKFADKYGRKSVGKHQANAQDEARHQKHDKVNAGVWPVAACQGAQGLHKGQPEAR